MSDTSTRDAKQQLNSAIMRMLAGDVSAGAEAERAMAEVERTRSARATAAHDEIAERFANRSLTISEPHRRGIEAPSKHSKE